jgi:hypothetical protein
MSSKTPRSIIPGTGLFNDLAQRGKLIWRLMGDSRVNPLLKLLPVGSLAYLVFPDFLPGPIDDAMILWLGTYLFVELCPPDVVQEHLEQLRKVVSVKWEDTPTDADTIDAEFTEVRTAPGEKSESHEENQTNRY